MTTQEAHNQLLRKSELIHKSQCLIGHTGCERPRPACKTFSFLQLDGQLEEAINGSEEVRKEARLQLANTLSLMQQLEAYVDDVLKS